MAKRKKINNRRTPTQVVDNGAQERTTGRPQRPFPARLLEEALAVPQAIRDKNNGKDWDAEQVAVALGTTKKNTKFFYLAASSRDFGLTRGSRDTETIGLTDLGKAIVFAGDEKSKIERLCEAFFSIDIYKRVFEHYGSGQLPEDKFLNNVLLSQFNLTSEFHAEFRRTFEANCKFLKIDKGAGVNTPPRNDTIRAEHGADIRVVGEPKGKFDRVAFVIMPFGEKGVQPRPVAFFQELLTRLITPAANAAGFAVETAEQDGSDVIQSTIINQLLKADLVVADLSDHNPNVLFELGIRIAKELPVALIKAEGTGRIFDVDNMMRVLPFSPNLWPSTVERDLPKLSRHIKAAWDNRTTVKNYMQILTGTLVASQAASTD